MSTGEQLDWFNRLRLRIQLLPDNPYFQDTVVEVRHELGIPVCGLRNREGLGQWMYDHLKAHAPNFLPQEPSASGLSSEATKNARRITLENLQKRAERCVQGVHA